MELDDIDPAYRSCLGFKQRMAFSMEYINFTGIFNSYEIFIWNIWCKNMVNIIKFIEQPGVIWMLLLGLHVYDV